MDTNKSTYGLDKQGFENLEREYWNLSTPALYEKITSFREGFIAHLGPIVVRTGHHTGRSPKDKFIVEESGSQDHVWWGDVNQPFTEAQYQDLRDRMMWHFRGRAAFVQDCFAGHDERYQIPIRIITEYAWHSLFARNIFVRIRQDQIVDHIPEYTIIAAPNFHAVPKVDGTHSSTFILVHLGRKEVLIGGTEYSGEIKKSIFTIMNYLMPLQNVMSMHCSANYGTDADDVAIFFGLSGTGKTTLSADSTRTLIGDDEHGWSDDGVFNYEGGCYAKVIRLDPETEPEIYDTTRRFGSIIENVVLDLNTRRMDLDDSMWTENTRSCYPLTHNPKSVLPAMGGHPKNIFFLTADAFGVLPPISKLTPAQAQYHFLSGYTAKVGGTERGLGDEPQATFSTCFGAPFMVHHPTVYSELLSQKIETHQCNVWLVNTGWTGGAYGDGKRISLAHTRTIVKAALDGCLDTTETKVEPVFGLHIPLDVPGVPNAILQPRDTWRDGAAYDSQASKLAAMFHENFAQFSDKVAPEVLACKPNF